MELRKMILFSTILGLTIPKQYTNALGLSKGDYAEVYLKDKETLIIKRHGVKPKGITIED